VLRSLEFPVSNSLMISSFELSYVFGPLGLLLMAWVWLQLRFTRYRETAVLLLTIILLHEIIFAVMYVRGAAVSFEERANKAGPSRIFAGRMV
jgi:hypothetical protein